MLVRSDDLVAMAVSVRAQVADRLRQWSVPGELELTGALSTPGVLTKGDVDLHLRVAPPDWALACRLLAEHLEPAEPGAWAATLQVFAVPGPWPAPVGLAATPCGSEHDRRFVATWSRLRDSEGLRRRYDELKAQAADDVEREVAKSAFFDEVSATHDPPA